MAYLPDLDLTYLDLAALDIRLALLGTIVVLVGAAEFGLRFARLHHAAPERNENDNIGVLQTSALGLLALMIGFTFSMALGIFEARKAAVVDEANAIGGAMLHARLLPSPQAEQSAALLAEYARSRVIPAGEFPGLAVTDPFAARALELHEKLWRVAQAAVNVPASVMPMELYLTALDKVIDMHGKRMATLRNRVPPAVFLLLLAIGVVAMGFTGYNAVRKGKGQRIAALLTAVMISAVIVMVADLDSPRRGLINVSQQPLRDLIGTLPPTP